MIKPLVVSALGIQGGGVRLLLHLSSLYSKANIVRPVVPVYMDLFYGLEVGP